jgi:uncharacterized protein YeaO (DUF488 family)
MSDIFLKRIYEPADDTDGYRVLIDRLWPRGIKKEDAKLSEWAKEVAPSNELRKWFCHKPELFEEFQQRYLHELRTDNLKSDKIAKFCSMAKENQVTFLYGAKDPIYNHARVLREEVLRRMAAIE